MGDQIRFDGKVAIVTGAGGGLGRIYALQLASRGCKVVVNDLGGGMKGEAVESNSERPADKVVAEIKALGSDAVPNYDSVEFGEKIVKTALDAYGRVDILINNAGILIDKSMKKMQMKDFQLINKIHLEAVWGLCKAVWKQMLDQGYGRIINVTSAAGLYGNVGQANYSAAKLGVVGLTQTLAKEGKGKILANCIAPIAASRMTATVLPEDLLNALKPEFVAPLVSYLASDKCEANGETFEVGAGWIAQVKYQRSAGAFLPVGDASPEAVANMWDKVTDFSEDAEYPASPQDSFGPIFTALEQQKAGESKL